MTSYVMRKALIDDLPQLVALLSNDDLGNSRESILAKKLYEQAFLNIEQDSNTDVFVLAEQENILAMAQIHFLQHLTHQGGLRGQIEGVRVAQSHRGNGLGSRLIQALIELCKTRQCVMVQLTTNTSRKEALTFYKKLGFTNTHYGLKLLL